MRNINCKTIVKKIIKKWLERSIKGKRGYD